jgi:sterol desaturase/sphingolipid hydroxylase (fatty acid hydroxylase superfamily)
MRLSKVGYYSEFVVYPVITTGLALPAFWQAPDQAPVWLATFAAGVAMWTLIEYLLHRYVLHHVPYIKELHDDHHSHQQALIGTPIWLSLSLFAVFAFIPLWLLTTPVVTAGLAGGLMLGYFFYGGAHHIIHHWRVEPDTFGYRLKRRHMLHHHFDDNGNFGVTNGFWDVVFATNIKVRGPSRSGEATTG